MDLPGDRCEIPARELRNLLAGKFSPAAIYGMAVQVSQSHGCHATLVDNSLRRVMSMAAATGTVEFGGRLRETLESVFIPSEVDAVLAWRFVSEIFSFEKVRYFGWQGCLSRSSEFSIDCFSMTPSSMSCSTSSCCDLAGAIAKLDGDVELLRDLAALFIGTLPDRLSELQAAMVEDCPRKISDPAHTMKGSVRYFLADSTYAAAQQLELVSIFGERSDIDRGGDALLCEVERLQSELVTAMHSNGRCFPE